MRRSLLLTALLLFACSAPPAAREPRSTAIIEHVDPPIDGFFAKRMRYGGIAILGHASVSDEGILAVRERLERVLAKATRLTKNLETPTLSSPFVDVTTSRLIRANHVQRKSPAKSMGT